MRLFPPQPRSRFSTSWRGYALHAVLFLLTLLTTTLAGSELVSGQWWLSGMSWERFLLGLPYSLSFLAFLTVHEFGHYFTARYHRVHATLPYYIPILLPFPGILNIGSLGAVIALRQQPESNVKYFDIGIAGPLAGFAVSVALLAYGLTHLPDPQASILRIHPEYLELFGGVPTQAQLAADPSFSGAVLAVGSSLLFEGLKWLLVDDPAMLPPAFELMHNPYLFVGYITLFFTALNLLPIGQLDGGHITYGMFGSKWAGRIARVTVVLLLLIGGTGLMTLRPDGTSAWLSMMAYALFAGYVLNRVLGPAAPLPLLLSCWLLLLLAQALAKTLLPGLQVNLIWLVYALAAVRLIGIDHPRAYFEPRLDPARMALGWLAILIFILCFTPSPLVILGE